MQACPHCNNKVDLAGLRHQGMFKSHRICPHCSGYFTVDKKTKFRQAVFIVAALGSLALTILLDVQGAKWLFPALLSYLLIGIGLYWANKHVYLVPYKKEDNNHDNQPGN